MDYDPEDNWSPASWLSAYANVLYNDYLNYWELQNVPSDSQLSEGERANYRRLSEVADALTPCLHSLSVDKNVVDRVRTWLRELGATNEVDEALAALVARAMHQQPIIRDRIRLDLATEAADGLLAGAEDRATVLLGMVANRNLSTRAAAFLDRATRLYLWGFGPESVVMCASVLEAAYESRFSALEMFRLQIQKKGAEYEPYEYEHAAVAAKVFTSADRTLAQKIRRARNDTLHNAPNVGLDPQQSLEGTARLLDRLFPNQ